ncbi:SAM-dependent methyltransferase [Xylella fastidiosa]|uniref:site-specific DNA-methyltransferase (adenine-specific) n=1 Tax=Xylella fastidiosa subsp. fastidiosa TaxID=644356 RepID=A0AAJ5UI70_XYLFS|nr:class I SAM-dependent methyltransferase [Xylella fastidiosa]KQH72870.1 SAM-dependent methyltransferase [Xylella fastidiosa]WCF27714.1 class I SAM-dependent methyltransferase [Xylella fastidiosa subsp. fastidiosa]WNY18513.1 class I SAM-dependent methyltransferase [Xylella fastidiosa]WNY20799.1 class I SAM-dependent methyltransferase [Xylella fastidiosa]
MNEAKKRKIEFGDFQTPSALARLVCERLSLLGFAPDVVIEPTCGVGAFVLTAAQQFPRAEVHGYEINPAYLDELRQSVEGLGVTRRVNLHQQDFFETDWLAELEAMPGNVLVLGNPPWVTNAGQGAIGGTNLPQKSNFLKHKGFDAITGKANFDISEWMLIDLMRTLGARGGDLAMLVKTTVARKIIAHAERMQLGVSYATIFGIDAKRHFDASVDACLLAMRFTGALSDAGIDYDVHLSLDGNGTTRRVGHRLGLTVGDLVRFEQHADLIGSSPQKWRSGVKHDASSVMEFDSSDGLLRNGLDEEVRIELEYLYPLMKGSDIGSNRDWRGKFVLVTQRKPEDETDAIRERAPRTWQYLDGHGDILDARGSAIYRKNPRFAIFGIGDYAFRPWRIAICGLYKKLNFRLVGPIEGKPVQFDDTVYYVSFDSRDEAQDALERICSIEATELYSSLIFWDEKRPIKSSVLNAVDWSRLPAPHKRRAA